MTTASARVCIGVPVYNGARYLERALSSLLVQDFPSTTILVSDNASDDETPTICSRLAAAHPQIRVSRNAQNIGAMPNFLKLVEEADSEFFCWAAHDDSRTPDYISRLVECLDRNPDAVLATPTTVHLNADGSLASRSTQEPACGGSPARTFRQLLRFNSCSWIYGLYRTEWLKAHVKCYPDYATWGGDLFWLSRKCLEFPFAGCSDAILFKGGADVRSSYRPSTPREKLAFRLQMYRNFAGIWWNAPLHGAASLSAFWTACRYGGNPLGLLRSLRRVATQSVTDWFTGGPHLTTAGTTRS